MRRHHQHRLAVDGCEDGAQRLVPSDNAEAALERGDVKLAPHADPARDVIGEAAGLEPVDEPEPLLREGQGLMVHVSIGGRRSESGAPAVAVHAKPRHDLGLASGQLVAQRGGQRALGSAASEPLVVDREPDVEVAEVGQELDGCQGTRSRNRVAAA